MEQEIKSHKNTNVPEGMSKGSQGPVGICSSCLSWEIFPLDKPWQSLSLACAEDSGSLAQLIL